MSLDVQKLTNLTGDLQVMISLKLLEDLLDELQKLRKYKLDNENKETRKTSKD